MSLDLSALVAPLSEEAPSGADLSYEAGRQQIEAAFERSVSTEGDGEDTTDWRGTIHLILAEAQETRDLWLAVYLMRASAQAGDFELLVQASEFLAALLEERWDDVHPQLDEVGFLGRKTPCESLTRIVEFLAPLGRVPLVEHPRFGRFTGADFERFRDDGDQAEGYGPFRATIEANGAESLSAIVDRLDAMRQAIRRADSVLTARAEGDTATNFQPTYDAIERIRRAVAHYLPEGEAGGEDGGELGEGGEDGFGEEAYAGGGGGVGAIRSRADVVRAIDAINAYYAKNEPGSPIPFVLRRARDWISLDFLSLLEDIAPDSLDPARRVLLNGRTNSGGYDEDASSSDDGGWSSGDDGWSS